MKTGCQKLIEQFVADGMQYMFGNPGTVEQGILDAAEACSDFTYITCLHESVAVAMADGYARKTKKPALVQLHSGVGLGNGVGMLYQALRGHSPLVVIAGEAGVRYDSMDAQMACDLVAMAKPVTKYATRVTHRDSVLRVIRRAVKIAATHPMGPVFIALPMDVLDEENTEVVLPSVMVSDRNTPDAAAIAQIAAAMADAKRPVILAGDGVNAADAVCELEACAKLLAAEVYGVNSSCINISQRSPYYLGDLGHMFGENSAARVRGADAVLLCGTYAFPEVFPSLQNPFDERARVFHIDLDDYEIAKNHPVELGLVANLKQALSGLNARLEQTAVRDHAARTSALLGREPAGGCPPPVMARFLEELRARCGKPLTIFDEALTASPHVLRYLPQEQDGRFFQTRGGSLGVGIPGAMGVLLADRSETVLVFTGDGGSMYTIQALYTAVRYQLPVKIVICKNNCYGLLENNIEQYWKERGIPPHDYPASFRLFGQQADIDFALLAQSMGVSAMRAHTPEQATSAAQALLAADEPFLVELHTAEQQQAEPQSL